MGQAAEPLQKLAKLSDASVKDIEAGRALMDEARLKTLETKALCDLITAQPVADDPRLKGFEFQDWERQRGNVQGSVALRLAREILVPLSAMHFPVAFPEVFLGRSQGFNVILGNPPWEKVKVEEYNFWAQKFPGLRGLTQRDFERKKVDFGSTGYVDFTKSKLSKPTLFMIYGNKVFFVIILIYIFLIFSFNRLKHE